MLNALSPPIITEGWTGFAKMSAAAGKTVFTYTGEKVGIPVASALTF
jgi:hypothetical protein